MITAETMKRYSLLVPDFTKNRKNVPPKEHRTAVTIALITICITVTSGVCSQALSLGHPIFIDKESEKVAYVSPVQQQALIKQSWIAKTNEKYPLSALRYPASGVAHVKMTKYINSKPIKINIVEINPKANRGTFTAWI